MIIGKNNPNSFGKPNFTTNSSKKFVDINNSNNSNSNNINKAFNPLKEKTNTMQHSNILSKDDITQKSFAMLQERLSNGTITLEEFNKMCNKLGKQSK